MVLVFDLDDTLYDESSYVRSGFQFVAEYLEQTYQIPASASYQLMLEKLKSGRGRIFDDLLLQFGIINKKLVKKCVSIYRRHQPEISLYPEADDCLHRLQHYPQYIVTDGNKVVQANKIKALKLEHRFKFCYITHRYGIKNAKPSPYCFQKICEREKVTPKEVVYIADNPYKDFVGIKPLGFKTVRVMKGQYKAIELPEEFEASYRLDSLQELTEDFVLMLRSKTQSFRQD